MKAKEIQALHKHDLQIFLNNIGALDDFKKGRILCYFCKNVVNENNIGAFYPKDLRIVFVCSGYPCLRKISMK